MAERAKDQKKSEMDKLEILIKKHEELIPTVMKTQVNDCWKLEGVFGKDCRPTQKKIFWALDV